MNHTSPLGVCVLGTLRPNMPHCTMHEKYIIEILQHAGLPFMQIEPAALGESLSQLQILVTVGEAKLTEVTMQRLRQWVQSGGCWLSLGSVCGLSDVHGVENIPSPGFGERAFIYPQSSLGEGYLRPTAEHPVLAHLNINLHYYNGTAVKVLSPSARIPALVRDVHGRDGDRPALVENACGDGRTLFLAPDAVGAVVRISHGTRVIADGVSAPDGSAPITDGVLKCDDGQVLDWHFDRQEVPGVPGLKGFFEPIADQWREIILRSIFYFAGLRGIALPLLWLYPRNLPAVAHLSHDSDLNDPQLGAQMLEEVNKAGIKSTWCMILDCYPPELMAAIKASGHELATHYDAIDFPWSEEEFISQVARLRALFGENPVSNKNHYTRWEGDTEFFDWCDRQGIQLDESKGPSKLGEVGFNFGSAQLYFPLTDKGEFHPVLELPLHTQDLIAFAPPEIIPPLLSAVEKHHGVLHVLFHQAHIAREGVAPAMHSTLEQAKKRGMEWFTARQLNAWERARRQTRLSLQGSTEDGTPKILLSRPKELQDATILVSGTHRTVEVEGRTYEAQPCTRWGFEFSAVNLGQSSQESP